MTVLVNPVKLTRFIPFQARDVYEEAVQTVLARDVYEEAMQTVLVNPVKLTRFIPFQARDVYEEAVQTVLTVLVNPVKLTWFIPFQARDARDVYEEAVQTVMTVRDFTQVFDSYARFEESVIAALLDTQAQLGRGHDGQGTPKSGRGPRK
ncbi:Pre-mRNA-splicing factor SYF1, partial [Lonchura striata]